MDVAVGKPGDDGGVVQVDGLRRRSELADLGVASHREDLAAGDRDRFCRRPLGIVRADARPDERQIDLAHASPFFAREGWTRFGSPGIFGKLGGYGASPAPSDSSRSTQPSSTRRSHTASSIPSCRSPSCANRAGMVAMVKSSISTSGSSSHRTGADTVASGLPRTEYAERIVRSRAFWL